MIRWNEPGDGLDIRTPVKQLLTKVRLRIKDMQNTKFSDYELLSALNIAVQTLWMALAERFSSLPRLTTILPMENGVAALPKDFYSLVHIQDNAAVDGFFVVSEEHNVEITYNRLPVPAINIDDTVEVPASMVLDVVEMTAALLTQGMGSVINIAMASANRIAQKREHGAIKDQKPFP